MKLFSQTAVALLLTLFAATTNAQTIVNFGPATSSGYATDNPLVDLSFINPNYGGTLIVQVNGVYYRGPVTYATTQVISTTYPLIYIQQATDVSVTAPDGSSIKISLSVKRTTTKVNSGRAHYYITRYFVLGGTLTLP